MLSQEGAVLLLPNGDGGSVLLDLPVFKEVWKLKILCVIVGFLNFTQTKQNMSVLVGFGSLV